MALVRIKLHQGAAMRYAWTVVEHTGEQITVARESEMLEIPRPNEPALRKVLMEIQVDESFADGIVSMLS
jgi:hypothetical protein